METFSYSEDLKRPMSWIKICGHLSFMKLLISFLIVGPTEVLKNSSREGFTWKRLSETFSQIPLL